MSNILIIRSGLNLFDRAIEDLNTPDCKSVPQDYSIRQPFPEISTKQSKLKYQMLKNYQFNSGSSTYFLKPLQELEKISILFIIAIISKHVYNIN